MLSAIAIMMLAPLAYAQGPLTVSKTYNFTGVTGLDYSIPLDATVTVSSNSSSVTEVTINSTPPVVNASTFVMSSSGGLLTASVPQNVNSSSYFGSVTIQVPQGSLSTMNSPASQAGGTGNITVAGAAINPAVPTTLLVSSGLVSMNGASSVQLVANIANRAPIDQVLANVTGSFGNVTYTGGPYTQTYLSGSFPIVAVTMYTGSSLNIAATDAPSIYGNYTSTGLVGQPGYIYYNQGSCNVNMTSANQATACMQV